jgi:excinuclease ABC subunit C
MRQYVQLTDEREKIPFLMDEAASFDYVVVGSEHEALVLELNLIQQYRPPYNVDYTDDKSYPFIAVTHGDTFPAIKYTRERHKPSTRYFGPYTDARAARDAIEVVRRVIPICSANCAEWRRSKRVLEKSDGGDEVATLALSAQGRPCFDFNVGKGPGACCGEITPDEYAANVRAVERFLQGARKEVVGQLTEDMREAAAELDFERAGRMKRRLDVIAGLDVRQQVVLQREVDLDLFGIFREETVAGACVFLVREGRVVRTCEFILDKGLDVAQDELVSGLLKRYYRETEDIPACV